MSINLTYFISVDWGTSSLRVRLIHLRDEKSISVIAQARSSQGVRSIYEKCSSSRIDRKNEYAHILNEQIKTLLTQSRKDLADIPVVISGMAGSSLGWMELPYAEVPFSLDGNGLITQTIHCDSLPYPLSSSEKIYILSGVRTSTDVMRGEEIEILGLMADTALTKKTDDCLLILPGTHSKHVHIHNQYMVDFSTCMTGELFDILSMHGVLSASLGSDLNPMDLENQPQQAAFIQGVEKGLTGSLLQQLFLVRTRDLLDHIHVLENRAWLRGLLLGAEIFSMRLNHQQNRPVVIAGASHWQKAYQLAFKTAGLHIEVIPAETVELAAIRGQMLFLKHHGN